jgi:hypothetical protein
MPVRRLPVGLPIRVRARRSTTGAHRSLGLVSRVHSNAAPHLSGARSSEPHAFCCLCMSMNRLLSGPRSGLTLRWALGPMRLLALLLALGLALLLSTWITTRRSLDPRYTSKVHGASWIVSPCGVVLGPSLDVGIIIMTVGIVNKRSWWSLSFLLLLLGVRLGLGVGGVCLLGVTGAIGLSLAGDILLSLNRFVR